MQQTRPGTPLEHYVLPVPHPARDETDPDYDNNPAAVSRDLRLLARQGFITTPKYTFKRLQDNQWLGSISAKLWPRRSGEITLTSNITKPGTKPEVGNELRRLLMERLPTPNRRSYPAVNYELSTDDQYTTLIVRIFGHEHTHHCANVGVACRIIKDYAYQGSTEMKPVRSRDHRLRSEHEDEVNEEPPQDSKVEAQCETQ